VRVKGAATRLVQGLKVSERLRHFQHAEGIRRAGDCHVIL
jgi:hypothetical protein